MFVEQVFDFEARRGVLDNKDSYASRGCRGRIGVRLGPDSKKNKNSLWEENAILAVLVLEENWNRPFTWSPKIVLSFRSRWRIERVFGWAASGGE